MLACFEREMWALSVEKGFQFLDKAVTSRERETSEYPRSCT